MANNSFSFQTVLRLNSKEFEKGINSVKKSLAGLKSAFLSVTAALGAGLGFSKLIGNMKDTAVQLSVAKNTLENVSNVTKEWNDGINSGTVTIKNYGENLVFVHRMADAYSQDLVALMNNFAQFHAACEKTNIGLSDQKMIFESLTRAAAYYHMSADRTRDMMNAIVQMASKGRVAAEELRRQLGNSLPGAFNMMAAALGVSTQQLDDMMRKGQVLSEDALPKFAAMLNTVTKGANFDSLQMSLNRLKNSWYELVENSGTEGMFKRLVDGAEGALSTIARSMDTFKAKLWGILTGILSFKLFSALKSRGETYLTDLDAQLKLAGGKIKRYEKSFESINQRFGETGEGGRIGFEKNKMATASTGLSSEQVKSVIKYNNELIKANQLENKLYGTPLMTEKEVATIKKYNVELAKSHGLEEANKKTIGVFKAGINSIGETLKTIWSTIKGMGIMAIASAIIGAVASIYTYIKNIRDEHKRINGLVGEYKDRVRISSEEVEKNSAILRANLKIAHDENRTMTSRISALKEINKLTGSKYTTDALDKTKKAYQDIVAEVKKWIDATKLQARIQVYAQEAAQAEIEIQKLELRQEKLQDERKKLSKGLFTGFKLGHIEIEENLNKEAIAEYGKIAKDANKKLEEMHVTLQDLMNEGGGSNRGGGGSSDISKLFENYTKEKDELTNQLKEHAITQDEYNEAFDKLVTKFWKSASATGKYSIDDIIGKMDKGKTLTKMEKWYKDLYDAAQQAAFNATFNATAEVVSEALDKSIDEALKEADDKFQDELDKWAEKAASTSKANLDVLMMDGSPKRGKRDNTFDYKKSSSEIFGEEADVARDWADEIKRQIDEIESKYDNIADASEDVRKKLKDLKAEYALATKEAESLEEAMKIRQIMEDIDELNKAIDDAVVGGIKNLAESADRVIRGLENIAKVFDDEDNPALKDFIDGWEKFMAIFNEVVQIIEMFTSISETLNTITKTQETLDQAELAMQQQKVALLEKEIAYRQALLGQKKAENKETEKAIEENITETAVSKGAASANASEAVAGATASGAKLPFPYNLVAIAAGIAAVVAALANMGKFAKGGIIGGNSYSGDKQMARVNSGEMILNKHQQGMLFNAINSGKLGGGNVTFRLRGTELIGCINNEMSKRKG